jgi:hypothetical protein
MDVVLALHWLKSGQSGLPDSDSAKFWQQIATKYKNEGRVIFEIYNEPYGTGGSGWKIGKQLHALGWISRKTSGPRFSLFGCRVRRTRECRYQENQDDNKQDFHDKQDVRQIFAPSSCSRLHLARPYGRASAALFASGCFGLTLPIVSSLFDVDSHREAI